MLRSLQRHTTPSEHEEGSTWLELFFDLVYVAILVELGNRLSGNQPAGHRRVCLLVHPHLAVVAVPRIILTGF